MSRCLSAALLLLVLAAGCKQNESAAAPSAGASSNSVTAAPGQSADMDATLAELTRELHRTMIGRHLSGSFEEFVAIRKLNPPPPPPGKKYAISKQWKVVLVDK